jgi:molybdenum cofactor sulfurtransferase
MEDCHEKSCPSESNWNVSQGQDRLNKATTSTLWDQSIPLIFNEWGFRDVSCFSGVVVSGILLGSWFQRTIKRRKQLRPTPSQDCGTTQRPIGSDEAKGRKEDFLSRNLDSYGYNGTPGGYIDDWRPIELPGLQPPIERQTTETAAVTEIYLDYAGAALPTQSQLSAIFRDLSARTVFANPHSTGPAATRSTIGIQTAKRRVLEHFDATPGRFASIRDPPIGATPDQCHPGYDLVFTSGATEGLRVVAERFPWRPKCEGCQRQSIFLYARNSHTSVVGMRNLVKRSGGKFVCRTLNEIEAMAAQELDELCGWSSDGCALCQGIQYSHLLAFPLECNFGGTRANMKQITALVGEAKSSWFTLLDIAKAASTGPVSLKSADSDFAVLSFYKLFGEPTGMGALIVKQNAFELLRDGPGHYQGGGSVDIMIPGQDVCVPRSEGLARLSHGTSHFRGIQTLSHGFDELEKRGGMHRIHEHARSLARELTRRIESLRHRNGNRAVVLSGAWADSSQRDTAGPTVTLNILRYDGSFVGYNEVSKLALLWNPPMQFRSGCFCNPGACQEALNLSDRQALHNFETMGHVCGDHIDLVDGRPTGAIRISFGKDSLWEDMDVFVQFLEKTFLGHDEVIRIEHSQSSGPCMVRISELYLFPIKSCSGQRVNRWPVELPSGKLRHDREFALVDSSGTAIRLQSFPKMTTIEPRIDLFSGTMTVSAPGMADLTIDLDQIPLHDSVSNRCADHAVRVCGDRCGGKLWGDFEVAEWFTTYLGVQCWLARFQANRLPETRSGPANPSDFPEGRRAGFANEQAVLLISENAVSLLNHVLEEQNQRKVGSRHFRPNVVVSTTQRNGTDDIHIEDDWTRLRLIRNGLTFETRGSCARCAMVDFDPYSGEKGKTLRALARYRRHNGQITFGVFLGACPVQQATDEYIQEGDEVQCN